MFCKFHQQAPQQLIPLAAVLPNDDALLQYTSTILFHMIKIDRNQRAVPLPP